MTIPHFSGRPMGSRSELPALLNSKREPPHKEYKFGMRKPSLWQRFRAWLGL